MKLKRKYYDIEDVVWGDCNKIDNNILTLNYEGIISEIKPLFKSVKNIDLQIVKPGENTRIIHVLDAIQPMIKLGEQSQVYSGFNSEPDTVGSGVTNVINNVVLLESAALPWDSSSASSGLLYPRDAIMDMSGSISGFTPFSEKFNIVIVYDLDEGKSSVEYDENIREIGIKISFILAELTSNLEPDYSEEFDLDDVNSELPNVVLVWQCQNQGVYANTFLYGEKIDDIVPTILHPNEMLDGCVVSGNYVWPAFKVPTYLHVNHPISLELYKQHGKTLNYRGIIFCRSHNPTNWHKKRCANINIKLAEYLNSDGLIMAWEGGGNAAVDGMLTIQAAEKKGIKASTITFEFGGEDGTEGILLVDDVPEADAIISGGSIEKTYTLEEVDRVVGGDKLRLNKESGGYFPDAKNKITFSTTTQFYLSGNQAGHSKLFAEEY